MITDLYEVDLEVLEEAICWRLVARAAFGRVAFFHEGELHVLPVNATVKDKKVIFRVVDGSLIAAAGHGAMVAFESDEIDPSTESGWSVLVRGSLWDVTDTLAKEWDELTVRSWAPGRRGRWMCVEPVGAVTGRMLSRRRVLSGPGESADHSPSTRWPD